MTQLLVAVSSSLRIQEPAEYRSKNIKELLAAGWQVKMMSSVGDYCVILLEKEIDTYRG